jgi:hypothetical protein
LDARPENSQHWINPITWQVYIADSVDIIQFSDRLDYTLWKLISLNKFD